MKKRLFVFTAALAIFTAVAAGFGAQDAIIEAMKTEIERAKKGLKTENANAPYFILYRLNYSDDVFVMASNGGVQAKQKSQRGNVYVETRVGDYSFDNTAFSEEPFNWFSEENIYRVADAAPLDGDETALRTLLWIATDEKYRNAAASYYQKKGRVAVKAKDKDKEGVDAFSKEEAYSYISKDIKIDVDADKWAARLKKLSERFLEHRDILDSNVMLAAYRNKTYIINTEGTVVKLNDVIFSVSAYGMIRTEGGDTKVYNKVMYAKDLGKFTDAAIISAIDEVCKNLNDLAAAPSFEPYTGPAIIMPIAAGVLFHEAIGHRLEGERQLSNDEGHTFKNKIGQKIVPEFLSINDDPTLETLEGETLNGYYLYDSEGVKAQNVILVEKGVLKNYLLSRTPIKGFPKSNGHGRASSGLKPRARMGNLIVTADAAFSVPMSELEKKLLEEVKKQNKPYGIIIAEMAGGDTNTSNYGYQAFKGRSTMVYKLHPDGKKELVSGVEIVGTPLSAVNKIVLASKERGVFNGFCGAESGSVPVSAISPAILLSEIELQLAHKDRYPKPVLSSPYEEMKGKSKDKADKKDEPKDKKKEEKKPEKK